MTLTNVIVGGASDLSDITCPFCGSRAWVREGVFARCRKYSCEVTIWQVQETVLVGDEA